MYTPKHPLLLERDVLMFDAWDKLTNPAPILTGGLEVVAFRKSAAHKFTFCIYGRIGVSDLDGKQIIEDIEVWLGEYEVTNAISDALIQEWTDAILTEAV
jgi:hypothetical protein